MPRQTVNGSHGEAAPHQPPAGGSFSLRAKSRLRRLRFDTRLRAQPQGGSHTYSKGPPCARRAFRAGVRNRKRRMAIVKWCRLTPGGVSAVRGGNTALWMPYTADCRGRRPRRPAGRCEHRPLRPTVKGMTSQAGCCLRGSSPSRRGAFYRRPSTGSPLRADMESAPTEPRGECPYITPYRTAYESSRAAASNPRRPGSRPRRRRHAGHP